MATVPPAFYNQISIGPVASPFRGKPGTGFNGIFVPQNAYIVGVTRDSNSNPLGGCTVYLYSTVSLALIAQTVSDGSGNYTFVGPKSPAGGSFFVVAYLPGSPDVAGTTINTLVPV